MYVTQALHRLVQQDPHRPMTICGGRVRSVGESADRVARLAAGLRGLGVRRGDRVAVLGPNSDQYHESLLAAAWADAVVMPIDYRWSPSEISYALRDCDASVLVADAAFLPVVDSRPELVNLRTVVMGDTAASAGTVCYEELIEGSAAMPDSCRGGDALFGIFYTGGTTARPKGVMLTHANMLTSAFGSLATGQFVTPGGRILHTAPMFHLAGLAVWTAALITGGTHVILPAFTPTDVLTAIEDHGITDILLVPTMIQLLVDALRRGEYDVSSLRHLVYGGAPMPVSLLARTRDALRDTGFVQAYGMTELAPVATLLLPTDHDDPGIAGSAGRAAPHAEVRVVGPGGTELSTGAVGEVIVRGGHVMSGYWGRPEETAAAVRDGWMHTGDAGYLDGRGYLFIVDRIKDMTISGGENAFPAEVEAVLAQHPGVAMSAVIGLPDDRWGERVHAVVVPSDTGRTDAGKLREHCLEHLARYKIPRDIEFVTELPVSAAGKVLKRQLRQQRVR
ncbi:long-chain fatty acid--CoA ligase [Micromonospora sp. NPDC050200]|uniref:acyl-CoA synthetase n=1 Tax=Micromonospora sp. NPDC050200 TaxID=3155664 RepID=UPI0033D622F1